MDAFKDTVSDFNQTNMNELITLQPFRTIFEGTAFDSKGGTGTTANNVFSYNFAIRVTSTGVTSLMRLLLHIDADGLGQDLTLLVKDTNFNPDGSNEGTTLATITVPKEFLPTSAGYFSIAINLTGLAAASNYWLIIQKAGDATDHFHLVGEASADGSHPCYRRSGSSGAWTLNNALHFNAVSGDTGMPYHVIYGTNGVSTLEYSAGLLSKEYFYLPPSDGAAGGIRKIMTLTYSGGLIVGGAVT